MQEKTERNNMENKQLENIASLLKHLLAIELYKSDVKQQDIGKHLKMSTASVNKLLKGIKKGKIYEQEK